MGGSSTSHSVVLGRQKTLPSLRFSLHSWQGLTEVLKVGKESLREATEYAEFRNLVLQYAQQGGDPELKKRIEVIMQRFNKPHSGNTSSIPTSPIVDISKSTPSPKSTPPQQSNLGTRRMQPQFNKGKSTSVTLTKPVSAEHEASPAIQVTKPVISHIETPSPEPQERNTPPVSAPLKSLEECKIRITEIKRLVNTHIGNPVALIDSQNDLGRKYMNALLGALKATGGGGTENIDSAMMRLEEAYTNLINKKSNDEQNKDGREGTPVVVTQDILEKKHTEESTNPVHIEIHNPEINETSSPVSEREVLNNTKEPEQVPEVVPFVKVEKKLDSKDIHHDVEYGKYAPVRTLASLLTDNDTEQTSVSVPKTDYSPESVPLVKQESASQTLPQPRIMHDDIRRPIDIDVTAIVTKQAELASPEITSALNQLLHEWNIFRGSGIFGMGPGGAEHPLYIKLAPLSMGEVLAGRWEKASPKIIKTIKEYTSAWHHERNIIYTMNETFEHYLRRVVQRILKNQK